MSYSFEMTLVRDTTFGRGDGIAGLVDQEIEHDHDGLPYMRGRTLKGLWSEACESLIYPLPHTQARTDLYTALYTIFGQPGGRHAESGKISVDNLVLPAAIAQPLREAVNQKILSASEVLTSLTTIRRQTSIDEHTGVAAHGSLRAMRVLMRKLCFESQISFNTQPTPAELALLTAGAKALRYVGTNRNRGRGVVTCDFVTSTPADQVLQQFEEMLYGTINS